MSPTARDVYYEELNEDEVYVLKNFLDQQEMGHALPIALMNAQTSNRNRRTIPKAEMDEALDGVMSKLDGWFSDVPESQRGMVSDKVRSLLQIDPNPTSSRARDSIVRAFNTNWTRVNGYYIQGNANQLEEATKINPAGFDVAFQGYVQTLKNKIEDDIQPYGLTMKDVYPVTDPKAGTIQLAGPYGPIPGTRIHMNQLKPIYSKYKHEREKEAAELSDVEIQTTM